MALLQCVEVHNGHVELFNSSRRVKRARANFTNVTSLHAARKGGHW